ncbi:hypothetical protein EDB84DRAFT_1577663 [Lactarius hengduanensis]|nr:hypothetical protein EDB84DRAFT_1577663 [Lactarius hengduanensis]
MDPRACSHPSHTTVLVLPMDSHRTRSYGISSPPPYIGAGSSTQQSVLSTVGQNSEALDSDRHAGVTEAVYTIHPYDLKEYAFISIKSHASNTQDVPLVYLGEQTTGSVVFPEYRLHEVRRIIVVLRVFISDPTNPTYKTKLVLLSEQIDSSHISNKEFCWRFAIGPPSPTYSPPSPLTAPEQANPSVGRPSLRSHDSNLKSQLQITIHRRGCLTRKLRMKQPIRYIIRPDPSTLSPALSLARKPPLSWTENTCPEAIVRGTIFNQIHVEVECKLIIPTSYPVSDEIPLSLVMTCGNRAALDLFAVSHVIDVRLLKVLAFGKNAAATTPPFTMANRKSYHITKWVAKAQWNVDGQAKGHILNGEHRWRIRLNGKLLRDPCAEMSHSLSEPGIALMAVQPTSSNLGGNEAPSHILDVAQDERFNATELLVPAGRFAIAR